MNKIDNKCGKWIMVDIEKLVPHPRNDNTHTQEHAELLAKVIAARGIRHPIIVSKKSGFIVAGHLRLMACRELGIEKYPVEMQDFENEADEYQFLTSDNNVARYAELDKSKMLENLEDLDIDISDFDFEEIGLLDFEVEKLDEENPGDYDAIPEIPAEATTKKGDVWILDKHRVMCGDSTMIDEIETLMNGNKTDMVFTDPPYGMNLNADYSGMKAEFKGRKGGLKHDNVKGDHDDFSDDFINNIFGFFGYCEEIFLWGADYYSELLIDKNEGSWIVWDKRLEDSADKMFGSCFEMCWSKTRHKRDIARIKWAGFFGSETQDIKKRQHPTQKPFQLTEWFFDKWGEGLNSCVDLFLGSGSTLMACEKTNRTCYGMELDEKYCDVVVKRWQDLTGKGAILESTGENFNELTKES